MTHAEYEMLAELAAAPNYRVRMNEIATIARLSPSGSTSTLWNPTMSSRSPR